MSKVWLARSEGIALARDCRTVSELVTFPSSPVRAVQPSLDVAWGTPLRALPDLLAAGTHNVEEGHSVSDIEGAFEVYVGSSALPLQYLSHQLRQLPPSPSRHLTAR